MWVDLAQSALLRSSEARARTHIGVLRGDELRQKSKATATGGFGGIAAGCLKEHIVTINLRFTFADANAPPVVFHVGTGAGAGQWLEEHSCICRVHTRLCGAHFVRDKRCTNVQERCPCNPRTVSPALRVWDGAKIDAKYHCPHLVAVQVSSHHEYPVNILSRFVSYNMAILAATATKLCCTGAMDFLYYSLSWSRRVVPHSNLILLAAVPAEHLSATPVLDGIRLSSNWTIQMTMFMDEAMERGSVAHYIAWLHVPVNTGQSGSKAKMSGLRKLGLSSKNK
ncbi:hypothetical protein C8R45DRAFT_935434 [Mycena sanguinolenta]|nr:hypothetical protein C8R45DRAFT_935434 [Mycena sanguinolenta]